MSQPNYERMMKLIDEVFATRQDQGQLQVTSAQQKKLARIHSATLSEYTNEDGPLIWVLMIPTTEEVMQDFIDSKISEKELLDLTPDNGPYTAIYLCSVTTLPEMRGKGKTKELCLQAINAICKDHPIKSLFVWPFTREGNKLAETLSGKTGLSLLQRTN
jgi:hypothetical protein